MLMTNFLTSRKSERDYKTKSVSLEVLENINDYLKELEKEDGSGKFSFKLFENGKRIYEGLKGLGGYGGVMIDSPHYIALEFANDNDASIIYGAYYMEKLISELSSLGLGSCWVSLLNVEEEGKQELFGKTDGQIDYLLAFGYGKTKNPFIAEPFSNRIGVDEMVFLNTIGNNVNSEVLETRGLDDLFYYVRFSPSALNYQPWRFILENDKVTLLLEYEEGKKANLIDAGVIMYYFEELGKSVGVKDKWNLIDKTEKVDGLNYKYIAEISL